MAEEALPHAGSSKLPPISDPHESFELSSMEADYLTCLKVQTDSSAMTSQSAPQSSPFVPVVRSLSEIYPPGSQSSARTRWNRLASLHQAHYGKPPQFIVRAPGRVNVIGEHIDYSLFPVLPMAIEEDVLISCKFLAPQISPGAHTIRLSNVDPSFPGEKYSWALGSTLEALTFHEPGDWRNYFLAAAQGVLQPNSTQRVMDMMVDGNVPHGAGLSSSAALVVASALALSMEPGLKLADSKVSKEAFVQTVIQCERNVGVNSGGMDQSASVFGERGKLVRVQFAPTFEATPVALPRDDGGNTYEFLVVNSLVHSKKSDAAETQYNLRVVECTFAALVLAKMMNLPSVSDDSSPLGAGLWSVWAASHESPRGLAFQDAAEQLNRTGYTLEEIASILETSEAALTQRYMTKFPVKATEFLLRQRTMHVLNEANRVSQFIHTISKPHTNSDPPIPQSLGKLMSASQRSLRELYECSTPEIHAICEIVERNGGYGSRLTGAGWGGCTVHLVPSGKVEGICDALRRDYFRGLGREEQERAIIRTAPGSGACFFNIGNPSEGVR